MLKILLIFYLFYLINFVYSQSRIVGGEEENINKVPYQLSMWNGTHHYCGAILISSKWALSAAHCLKVYPIKDIFVRFKSSDCTIGGELIKILSEHRPRYYNIGKNDYDIGAIELDKFESKKGDYVELANCRNIPWPLMPKIFVTITGWGFNDIKDVKLKNMLQTTKLRLIDNDVCYKKYMNPPYNYDVTARMMCAKFDENTKPTDACQGDSGGPVTYLGNLIGIISAGFGCAKVGLPGFYTNISDYSIRKFIKETTGISNC